MFCASCAFCASLWPTFLEEDSDAKLNIPWRVVREESTKVRIVHLSRAVKFQALDCPVVKRFRRYGGKTFWNPSNEENVRLSDNRLTRFNIHLIDVEYAIVQTRGDCVHRIHG